MANVTTVTSQRGKPTTCSRLQRWRTFSRAGFMSFSPTSWPAITRCRRRSPAPTIFLDADATQSPPYDPLPLPGACYLCRAAADADASGFRFAEGEILDDRGAGNRE